MIIWRRLLGYLRPYKGRLAVAIVAMFILAVTTGTYPILLDLLTTVLVDGEGAVGQTVGPLLTKVSRVLSFIGLAVDPTGLVAVVRDHVLVLFGTIVAVKAVSQAVRFYAMGALAQRVVRDLRRELFSAIVGRGSGLGDDQATGFLVSRIINDVTQVERAATYAIPVLVGDALRVLALGTVCLLQYTELSLVSAVVLPLAVLPIVQFGKMLKRYAKRSQQALGGLTNRITETLGGIRVVHSFGREAYEVERFDEQSALYVRTMMRSVLVRAVQTPAMEIVGVLAVLITIGYAVGKVDSGEIRPGEVVGFLLALVLLYEPIKAIGRLNSIVMPGVAAAERVFEITDRPPEVEDTPDALPLEVDPELVCFEKVSFRYRTSQDLVLREVDLRLPRGKLVALVGPSGGGKSTIAALLPRLFDVTDGRITFDGTDIRKLTVKSLRSRIALVSQDVYLFNDSIRANIGYGRPEATPEEIEAAARQAFAHDFIMQLPQGYDSVVGERGAQLSGGQRQRIAIARAFLRDAPILILDEATSALDVESEREVQRALDGLMARRTALVIAHRLSTIRAADDIVVLDQGRIQERGRHDDLMALNGLYASLVRTGEVGELR